MKPTTRLSKHLLTRAVCSFLFASLALFLHPVTANAQTGTFGPTGSMTAARYDHTSTLLPNGKVLIAGGTISSGLFLASAELYDPTMGTFSATGSMTTARYDHTSTLLPTGKVLIAGGANGGPVLASAELYDPTTGAFSATGSMTTPRAQATATLLLNGKVLIAGGEMC